MWLLFRFFIFLCTASICHLSSDEIHPPKSAESKLSVTLPTTRESHVDSESKMFPNQSLPACDVYCAYSTMFFHRSKMSEYLCHQYLANEILEELGGENRRMSPPVASRQTALLDDEGSSGYSIWLNKNNFWDEEENQFDPLPEEENSQSGKDDLFDQTQDSDYETGEITGFALPAPANTEEEHYPANAVEEEQYPANAVGEEHFPSNILEEHYPSMFTTSYSKKRKVPKQKESWPSPRGKGWIGQDIFDIGLSALAFLAFGSFITNLLITCLLGNQNTTVVVQMSTTTMTSTGTGTGTGTGRASGSSQQSQLGTGTNVDQLANMVLLTLDKLEDRTVENKNRPPRCLHYTLCNNNRVNKVLESSQRLWLPLWSFALSWLSGRLEDNRLENLRASVLGLGGASCSQLYPNCE